VLAAVAAAARKHHKLDRVAFSAGDAFHAIGPAVVFTLLADGDASRAGAAVIALAFAAQLGADLGSSALHEILSMDAGIGVHLRMAAQIWAFDLGLGSVGLLAAAWATREPWAALGPLPLVLVLQAMAADRTRRVSAAYSRQVALDQERARHEAAAALLRRQNDFLEDVSHELRTPVTIARGHLEMLLRERGPVRRAEVAIDELRRMERIVERLLMLARTEHPGALVREPVDMEGLLEDCFVRWSDTIPRPWVLGDLARVTALAAADSLRAALDALLENAVKHTTETQAIRLSSRVAGDRLEIVVTDEGRGIPREAVGRIFERFARADAGRTRAAGGAGLGLALVASVARAHGGECTVDSSPAGSAFTLRLPLARA
jgi:signal transduction histidine kinase